MSTGIKIDFSSAPGGRWSHDMILEGLRLAEVAKANAIAAATQEHTGAMALMEIDVIRESILGAFGKDGSRSLFAQVKEVQSAALMFESLVRQLLARINHEEILKHQARDHVDSALKVLAWPGFRRVKVVRRDPPVYHLEIDIGRIDEGTGEFLPDKKFKTFEGSSVADAALDAWAMIEGRRCAAIEA